MPNLLVADFAYASPPQFVGARSVAETEIERFDPEFLKARMGRRAADLVQRNEQLFGYKPKPLLDNNVRISGLHEVRELQV